MRKAKWLSVVTLIALLLGILPAGMLAESEYDTHVQISATAIDAETIGITVDGEPDTLYQWFTEKYNVSFEYQSLTWANYRDQVRMWINGGTAPDMMMLDINNTNYSEYVEWCRGGAFKPIPALDNYPTLKALYDKFTDGKMMEVDGVLYAWPAVLDTAKYNFTQVNAYYYRTDWAKAVGLYQEDDIYTWDEWWALVDAVLQLNPGNGGETLGIAMNEIYRFPQYLVNGISPNMFSFVKQDDGWVFGATLPESMEAVAFIKDAYDKGLIWQDLPFMSSAATDRFNAGKMFAYHSYNILANSVSNMAPQFEAANPDLKYFDVVSLAHVEFPNGKLHTYQASDHWSETAFRADVPDEVVLRVMDMLEFLSQDESFYTRNIGLKDIDWTYDENGEVQILWPVDETGRAVNPHQNGTLNWVRFAGSNDTFALIDPALDPQARYLVTRGFELMDSDATIVTPRNTELLFFLDPDYTSLAGNLSNECYIKFAELIVQPNFMELWEAWVGEKNAELKPAIDALNRDLM